MKATKYSVGKKELLKEISENTEEGIVRLLFEINKKHREKISKELRQYGQVFYDQFPWARYLGLEVKNPQKTQALIDRLYRRGIKGILDVDVDSRTLILAGYSKERY